MKRDLCPDAVRRMLNLLVAKNHPDATDKESIFDYPSRTIAQCRIVNAVMATNGELDRRKVTRMVNSLWECEG